MSIYSDCIRSYLLLLVFSNAFSGAKTGRRGSEASMGDGALKSVEVWRTGQGKLPILGSVDMVECADILGRLGGI